MYILSVNWLCKIMAKGISDKSKHFTLLALNELSKIGLKYTSVPKIEVLGEEQTSWLNERIRSFHESAVKTNYKKFSFLPETKKIRNLLAHSTGDVTKEEISNAWNSFFRLAPNAKTELEENIKRSYSENKKIRQFEKFGSEKFGNEIERKLISQSISEQMDLSIPDNEKLRFDEIPLACEANKFFHTENPIQKELLDFAKAHSELSNQIQAEVLEKLQTAYDETDITNSDNPFNSENLLISKLVNLNSKDFMKKISEYQKLLCETATGNDNSAYFEFYKKQYDNLIEKNKDNKEQKDNTEQIEILARNLKADLKKSLDERYNAWQLEEIDKRRKAYLEELYKKIEQFKKLQELLSPIIKKFGRLWDLSTGIFEDCGFEILKDFADLLENDEALKELAELIGRQDSEIEKYEIELREKTVIKTEYHPKPAYKGQISGLRLSGEISSALPSELAMSKNPALKVYFSQKFAEKKLLSYAYISQQKSNREETKKEEYKVKSHESEQKGPVILCIDTSGSMNGTPERIAKTLTFALAKKCIEEERGCYLLAFSTDYKAHNLTEFNKENGLKELENFLRMSFNGGTDVEPAINHSIEMLQKNEWKKADILVITDGIMNDFSEEMKKSIKAQQENETKFYSLVIGASANPNVIAAFDENWNYDTNARDAMHHLVRQMKTVSERR